MNDCIVCRIAAGCIPSRKVYEDDLVLAFLDISPVSPGHVLVVPKEHFNPLWNVPDEVLARLLSVAKRIAKAQMDSALAPDGVNLFQTNGTAAGQTVFHVHFHVIPRKNGDGAGWTFPEGAYASPEEADATAAAIAAALEKA
ncbi:MAG: HIT family protein [Kiritimatiellae bacterium]|nr:HIT family protein [Kiritimatiellia bacterium]